MCDFTLIFTAYSQMGEGGKKKKKKQASNLDRLDGIYNTTRLKSSLNKQVIHKYTFSDSSDDRYSLQVG